MRRTFPLLVTVLTVGLVSIAGPDDARAQVLEADVAPLVESSCLRCHGPRTTTPLNLSQLGFDLTDHETFRAWEKVYTRVSRGEMPPAAAPQPDAAVVETALGSLKQALVEESLAARGGQRTRLRRLTKLEYEYTVQDLLGLDEALIEELSQLLPGEPDTGGFDVVAARQGISAIHVRSYLDAADRALDLALPLGPRPTSQRHTIDYAQSRYLFRVANSTALGMGIVKQLDDAYVAFVEGGSTYTLHSQTEGYQVPVPGRYRVTIDAYSYQADSPVTLKVYRGFKIGGRSCVAGRVDRRVRPGRRGFQDRRGHAVSPSGRPHRPGAVRSQPPGVQGRERAELAG